MAIFTIEASERENFEKWLKEHDAKVRADAIEEILLWMKNTFWVEQELLEYLERLKEKNK